MVKLLHKLILLFLLITNLGLFPQKTLEICFTRFGKLKKYEIHNGEELEYKLKGQYSYRKNKIVNLQDSFIVFSNDSVIKLKQLKAVRLRESNFLMRMFQTAFITGGSFFLFLNTTNNIINERTPILDPKATLIAGGLIVTGVLIKQTGIKRIRINEQKTLKILDLNFNDLSEKPEK